NIWRLELPGLSGTTDPVSFISSTQDEDSPQYSLDGKRVVFCSSRSGTREIWVASADGSNAVQLTYLATTMTGAPRWSPDGRQIVFDSNVGRTYDVYTIDANGGTCVGSPTIQLWMLWPAIHETDVGFISCCISKCIVTTPVPHT